MGQFDKEDVLTCRNFRMGSCPRSDPVILEERSDSIQVGCRTCRGGWVVTLPEGRKRARYLNWVDEVKRKVQAERERDRVKFFGQSGV